MWLILRADGTELQVIKDEMELVLEVDAGFYVLVGVLLEGGKFQFDAFLVFEEGGDVVDDCLDIVDGFLQFPYSVVHTGLVLQRCDDQTPFNGLATRRRILQNILRLT